MHSPREHGSRKGARDDSDFQSVSRDHMKLLGRVPDYPGTDQRLSRQPGEAIIDGQIGAFLPNKRSEGLVPKRVNRSKIVHGPKSHVPNVARVAAKADFHGGNVAALS